MKEELRSIEKVPLDVVDGRSGKAAHHHGHAVVADTVLPGPVTVIIRGHRDVLEDVCPDLVILGPLDAVLLNPGDGDAGLAHLFVDHLLGADHPLGGVVLHQRGLLVPLARLPDLQMDVGRKVDLVAVFLEAIEPDAPRQVLPGIDHFQEFRDDLVQGPPFRPGDFIVAAPLMALGQGSPVGVGIVPEVEARRIGQHVRGLAPHGHEDTFFFGHQISLLSNSTQVIRLYPFFNSNRSVFPAARGRSAGRTQQW